MGFLQGLSDPLAVVDLIRGERGAIAFDVGANAGHTAMLLAERFSVVHAFEPSHEPYQQMLGIGNENIVAHQLAVSNKKGGVRLAVRDMTAVNGMLVSGDDYTGTWGQVRETVLVPATTLDELWTIYGTPDFIKIDVEGHEVEVFEGGKDLLNDCQPRLLVEVHGAPYWRHIRELTPAYTWLIIEHPAYNGQPLMRHHHFYAYGVVV